jgi:hypothetical protein
VISSPRQEALITPIDGTVFITGTGPASQTVTVRTQSGALVAATTSDGQGNWRILVASSRLKGSQQRIYAELLDETKSSIVSFSIKKQTFLERVLRVLGGAI